MTLLNNSFCEHCACLVPKSTHWVVQVSFQNSPKKRSVCRVCLPRFSPTWQERVNSVDHSLPLPSGTQTAREWLTNTLSKNISSEKDPELQDFWTEYLEKIEILFRFSPDPTATFLPFAKGFRPQLASHEISELIETATFLQGILSDLKKLSLPTDDDGDTLNEDILLLSLPATEENKPKEEEEAKKDSEEDPEKEENDAEEEEEEETDSREVHEDQQQFCHMCSLLVPSTLRMIEKKSQSMPHPRCLHLCCQRPESSFKSETARAWLQRTLRSKIKTDTCNASEWKDQLDNLEFFFSCAPEPDSQTFPFAKGLVFKNDKQKSKFITKTDEWHGALIETGHLKEKRGYHPFSPKRQMNYINCFLLSADAIEPAPKRQKVEGQ